VLRDRGAPSGYRASEGGALVEIPEQQEAIRTMSALRAGGMSLRAIDAQVHARHGIKVSHAGVDKVLASPRGARQPA
jgi:hypothetical protein